MKTLNRYLSRQIWGAVAFVLLALLALFFVLDFIQELQDVGKARYTLIYGLAYVALELPAVAYQVMPIAALIGTIYAMAQFAANSEFTIMRASGLSTWRAVGAVTRAAVLIMVATFLVGEYAAPPADAYGKRLKMAMTGKASTNSFRTGFWIKDRVLDAQGQEIGVRFVNAAQVDSDGTLRNVRLYEFDFQMRLQALAEAERALYEPGLGWRLHGLTQTRFVSAKSTHGLFADQELILETRLTKLDEGVWPAQLDANVFASTFDEPKKMSVWALWKTIQHLRETHQRTQKHEIALWNKLVYPGAVVVMMLLALPFAYLHTRSGGVSLKLFAGIMLGIGFYVLNSLGLHLGELKEWPPALAALLPSGVALVVATVWLRWVERH